MTTIVDTNVILDILTDDPRWYAWSSDHLLKLRAEGVSLLITPVIYAELSVYRDSEQDVEAALDKLSLGYEETPKEALYLAGRAFLQYRRRGGARPSPLPDFFIGAHAKARQYRVVTRDPARYRTYFSHVPLLTPKA